MARVLRPGGDKPSASGSDGPGPDASIKYKYLKRRHKEYTPVYWRRLRALYAGGKNLLGNAAVMGDVFPRHAGEHGNVYEERKKRAFYINYPGEILNHVLAGLRGDPVLVKIGEGKPDGDYYSDFFEDCSPPTGDEKRLPELVEDMLRTALQCRRAWCLVDLPNVGFDFGSLAEEEKAGALNAYALEVPPECVVNWSTDRAGELKWALLMYEGEQPDSLEHDNEDVVTEYLLYTRTEWRLYRHTKEKDAKEPDDDDEVPLVASGPHTFKHVPLVSFELEDALWAMNLLESIAREIFNKDNSVSWLEYKVNFCEKYEFLGPETGGIDDEVSENAEDPDRARSQPRGPGHVQVRGEKDSAMYVSPPTEGLSYMLDRLKHLRDELHRVFHQMAQAVDNRAAAINRSADSKARDVAATEQLLLALGTRLRKLTVALYRMVSHVRQEELDIEATGLEKFNATAVNDLIERTLVLEAVSIPSATYQQLRKLRAAKADLGRDVSEEDVTKIEKELKEAITPDQFDMPNLVRPPGDPGDDLDNKDKGDKPDDKRPPPPPPPGAKPPAA